MQILRTLALAAGLLAAAATGAVAAPCAQVHEEAALQVRVLQTELMVAALRCDLRKSYNRFAVGHREELVRHGHILRRYFERAHGPRGRDRLTTYVTELANEASFRVGRAGPGYCADMRAAFARVLERQGDDHLVVTASRLPSAGLHGQAVCTAVAENQAKN